jgi:hypothetical protein
MKIVKLVVTWIIAGAVCFALYTSGLTEKWNYGGNGAVYLHIPKYPGEKFYLAEKDPNFKPKIKQFDNHPKLRISEMAGIMGIALAITFYILRKSP